MNTRPTLVPRLLAVLGALVLALSPAIAQDTPPPADAAPTLEPAPGDTTTPEPQTAPARFIARTWPDQTPAYALVGSLDDGSPYHARIEFSQYGAGIEDLALTHHYFTVKRLDHVTPQQSATIDGYLAVPFALLAVEIDDERVDLVGFGRDAPLWRELAPGHFEAIIETVDGADVARIERRFVLAENAYDFVLEQRLTNLSAAPIKARWIQTGPVNMPKEGATPTNPAPKSGYGGDKRRVRFGYVTQAQIDLQQRGLLDATVTADSDLNGLRSTLGKRNESKVYETARTLWPTDKTREKGRILVWAGVTDRYFTVIAHPLVDPDPAMLPEAKVFGLVDHVDRLVLNPGVKDASDAVVLLELVGTGRIVEPAKTDDASMGVYAGPIAEEPMKANPTLETLGIPDIIVYNFGGPCAFCTFPWLTHVMLAVLRFNHSFTGDWALAIILLVIVVRTVLHPITRWSQIRVQRFGAQMQGMAPKQKKIREKYKNDPQKQQAEMRKLWAEEGVNPAGMLGCLPMFLQSPIWIALYATLFFAVELRHQPAFYGVFQKVSGGKWDFLSDLSAADAAIPLPEFMHFSFPLWGAVTAINLLPILLGFVFFAHQKYMTPQTTTSLSPEQAQQQKMMKIMMVVMFPVIMYTAPSGLALYFITNSSLGILENKWIRSHMNKHGMLDPEKIKAERQAKRKGGGGFISRLQQVAERQQQRQNQAKNQGQGFGTGKSGKYTRAPEKKIVDRKYKKKRK
ncbi:MAG: hypothetical protein DHS20C14_06480 [Phycisphaeraceae bacterium]|nr:MAG: hypothetical protein DHS20C14_06480 [Phycisphaeraceae bacterium]